MSHRKISQGLKRAQSRLLNMNSKKILNNVALLYVVLIATISDLLYMVSLGSHFNVIIFILVAYVTSLFSKNMMVILIVALALTNMYDLGKKIVLKEGFEDEDGDKDKTDDSDESKSDESNSDEDKENNDEDDSKTSETKDEKMPEEFKKALEQMSNPETRKTIEGLKELEPMVDKIKNVVEMLK
jgi:hypothetical protein